MTKIDKLNIILKYLELGYTLPYCSIDINKLSPQASYAKADIGYNNNNFILYSEISGVSIIDPAISSLLKFVELLPEELFDIISRQKNNPV